MLIKEHGTRAGHRGCRAVVAEDEPRRSGAAATEAKVQAEAEPRWYRTNFAPRAQGSRPCIGRLPAAVQRRRDVRAPLQVAVSDCGHVTMQGVGGQEVR